MWESVRSVFEDFSEEFEGRVVHMYADHLGKVTVGIGCMLDTADAAWRLRDSGAPFVYKSDQAVEASRDDVTQEWQRVKADPSLATGGHRAARPVTHLQLTDHGVTLALRDRLNRFESTLKQVPEFAPLDDWPADAQLALFSMAWAMGPAFAHGGRWPNFRASCLDQDWLAAARNSVIASSWLPRRNAVNRGLLRNAAWTASSSGPLDTLRLGLTRQMPVLRTGNDDSSFAGAGYYFERPVEALHGSLNWLGYGPVSGGRFTSTTADAVIAFQRDEAQITSSGGGFSTDGIVGSRTWAALGYIMP